MKNKQPSINRSAAKWLPSAMAIGASASANAAVVQITFTGSTATFVTQSGSSPTFQADIGGDGLDDIFAVHRQGSSFASAYLKLNYGTRIAGAYANNSGNITNSVNDALYAHDFFSVTTNFLGLGLRTGWLELEASYTRRPNSARVDVYRFVFDDASASAPARPVPGGPAFTEYSAIPEPSSFALLTLGAAGLIARRRRQQAA